MAKKAHLKQHWVNTKLCSNKLKVMLKRKPQRTWNLKLTTPLIIPLLSDIRTQWKSFYSCLFLIINFLEMRSSPTGLPSRAEALLHEQAMVVWDYPPRAWRGGQFHSLWIRPHCSCRSTGMCFCYRWDDLPFLAWVYALINCLLVARGIIPQKLQQEHKRKMLMSWFEKKLFIWLHGLTVWQKLST